MGIMDTTSTPLRICWPSAAAPDVDESLLMEILWMEASALSTSSLSTSCRVLLWRLDRKSREFK